MQFDCQTRSPISQKPQPVYEDQFSIHFSYACVSESYAVPKGTNPHNQWSQWFMDLHNSIYVDQEFEFISMINYGSPNGFYGDTQLNYGDP